LLNKKKYICEGENAQPQAKKIYHNWTNTNKLLGKDMNYNGLKTGTTKTAGA